MIESALADQALVVAERERARAEAAAYAAMLDYAEQARANAEHAPGEIARKLEIGLIAGQIGELIGLSEGQAMHRLCLADRIRSRTPRVWAAFQTGRIDAARIREISACVEKLVEPESVALLDDKVVDYADSHTTAELRAWLRRFVVRVEAEHARQRAEAAFADRAVEITHDDEGMAWVTIRTTSLAASAIWSRVTRDAKTLPADGRTQAQKQADVAVDLLVKGTTEPGVKPRVDICVTVVADILAGARPGFAEATDGSWVAPAEWVHQLAATGDPFWWRMVIDPVTDDALSIEYLGRYAPDIVKRALRFVHGVCQAPGCLIPAEECDIDHERPWPHGRTIGHNLGPKCRRDHARKGHGLHIRGRPRSPDSTAETGLIDALLSARCG